MLTNTNSSEYTISISSSGSSSSSLSEVISIGGSLGVHLGLSIAVGT